MKRRGRDKLARVKDTLKKMSRAAYFTLDPVPFDAMLKTELYAERNNLEIFHNKTCKVMWPRRDLRQ